MYSVVLNQSKSYGERRGSMSEDIRHSSLFSVWESVDWDGRSGYRSQISPSPFHNSVDLGRSSGFNSNGNDRIGYGSQTS